MLNGKVGLGVTTGLLLHGVFKSVYSTPANATCTLLEFSIARLIRLMGMVTDSQFLVGVGFGVFAGAIGSSVVDIRRLLQHRAYQPDPALSGPRGPSL